MQRADDQQFGGRLLEFDQRDRIAEHVVHPARRARRRQCQFGIDQPQIVAVARPQHQPVRAEGRRPGIAVPRRVADREMLHR